MIQTSSKTVSISSNKRQFGPGTCAEVLDFCACDDNSTALPGKSDVKSTKKRSHNDYLSNLYQKFKAENPNLKVSFPNFSKMIPANYVLTTFINQRSCSCTQDQNVELKLKILKSHNTHVPSNPEVFIKHFSSDGNI